MNSYDELSYTFFPLNLKSTFLRFTHLKAIGLLLTVLLLSLPSTFLLLMEVLLITDSLLSRTSKVLFPTVEVLT